MTSPRPYGTQAELARRLGVNRSTVNRALAAGRLVPAADATAAAHGLLDIEASVARFAATRGHRVDLVDRHAATRATAPSTPAHGAAAPEAPADTAPTVPGPPAPAHAPDALAAAPVAAGDRAALKGQILASENAKTKIEIALKRGLRLLVDDIGRESHGLGARLHDHLQRVVDQLAARLAAVPSASERARLLHPEMHRVGRAFDAGLIDALRAIRSTTGPHREGQA
jgi:transcriptional regulator with XRE-family HTH domain